MDKSIIFCDDDALFCNKEYLFLEHFNKVYITTKYIEKYSNSIEKSLKKFGHTPYVKLSENNSDLFDFKVDFSTNKFTIKEKNLCYNLLDFCDNKIVLPNEILNKIPKNFSQAEFCSGLLKYYDLPQLENVYYRI